MPTFIQKLCIVGNRQICAWMNKNIAEQGFKTVKQKEKGS